MKAIYRSVFLVVVILFSACEDLTELNENPNGIDQATANPNLLMPTIMQGAANSYLNLGFNDIAGVMQHTQKTGWYTGHNTYDWQGQDWSGWYGLLRSNKLLYNRAVELEWTFHQGVALTMKSFIYGAITDLWGDAPYTEGVNGDQGIIQPVFDSQEVIYAGIIEDLKTASSLFATSDGEGISGDYDLYFGGDIASWQKFANSLLLRYYLRISTKMPEVARPGIEAVFASSVYMKEVGDDATMDFIHTAESNSFPTALTDNGTRFRNAKACTTLLDKLLEYDDPRLEVWFAPVRVQWIEDGALATKVDAFIRENGVLTNKTDIKDEEYRTAIAEDPTVVYTRHFNPALFQPGDEMPITGEYIGIPPGKLAPDYHNLNPSPGQTVENQAVSQYADLYHYIPGTDDPSDLLKARLMSAAETHFILAEAALKGWSSGVAKTNYENGVKTSLETWDVGGDFASYIASPGVAYLGTLEQVIEQKWIASWSAATEAWFDFRRTGLPALVAGPTSAQPVLPVRFNYSDDELLRNELHATTAVSKLEQTNFAVLRGKNSQWSKQWLIQGTGKPW